MGNIESCKNIKKEIVELEILSESEKACPQYVKQKTNELKTY